MKNENCEVFDEEDIVTMQDENGNPVKFHEVACVELDEKFYVLLSPAEKVEGIGEDEVIICKLEDQDEETQLIVPLDDEELMQRVFDEYLRTADQCECDCEDCEACDCDDDCDDCECKERNGCEDDDEECEHHCEGGCSCGCDN